MHTERYTLPPATAEAINLAKAEDRRVIAVGTTTVRVLESVAEQSLRLHHQRQHGHFHLSAAPVCGGGCVNHQFPPTSIHPAYARERLCLSGRIGWTRVMLETYAEAVREKYRFFSYGDAMLIMKQPFVFINMAMTADGKIASQAARSPHLAVGPTTNACWNYAPERMQCSPVPVRSMLNPTSRWARA